MICLLIIYFIVFYFVLFILKLLFFEVESGLIVERHQVEWVDSYAKVCDNLKSGFYDNTPNVGRVQSQLL